MKRRKSWNVTEGTEYNAKLARKLRKMALHAMRIANRYGVSYVTLIVMGDYVSARANRENGVRPITVVDDYMFTEELAERAARLKEGLND